ncbi:hypothetical protein KY330_05095 [Candidatus Woesearchaeota archaeon]|nr:hypothetical protein [Candidatus Woesearchaeota archaeon]
MGNKLPALVHSKETFSLEEVLDTFIDDSHNNNFVDRFTNWIYSQYQFYKSRYYGQCLGVNKKNEIEWYMLRPYGERFRWELYKKPEAAILETIDIEQEQAIQIKEDILDAWEKQGVISRHTWIDMVKTALLFRKMQKTGIPYEQIFGISAEIHRYIRLTKKGPDLYQWQFYEEFIDWG